MVTYFDARYWHCPRKVLLVTMSGLREGLDGRDYQGILFRKAGPKHDHEHRSRVSYDLSKPCVESNSLCSCAQRRQPGARRVPEEHSGPKP